MEFSLPQRVRELTFQLATRFVSGHEQFKATAVRLSQLPGVRVQDVAASLYIHPS
jgi:hypothetical protein